MTQKLFQYCLISGTTLGSFLIGWDIERSYGNLNSQELFVRLAILWLLFYLLLRYGLSSYKEAWSSKMAKPIAAIGVSSVWLFHEFVLFPIRGWMIISLMVTFFLFLSFYFYETE